MPLPRTLTDEQIKALISRRHPEIASQIEEWKFLKQAIDGGPAYVEGNLYKHPKEDSRVYEARKKRAADNHYNLTSQVLDTYQGYLFQQPPLKAEGLSEAVEAFMAECDQDGRPAIAFAKDVAYWMAGMGLVWVVVDKPPRPETGAALTAAQEQERGLKPYAYMVLPYMVLDGCFDRGELVWLLIQEEDRDDRDPILSTGEVTLRYRLWTRDEWLLITPHKHPETKEVFYTYELGAHNLGVVPVVAFSYYGSQGKFGGPGLVADIAHMDRGAFNKASLLDEILYQVTFPQLALPYRGSLFDDATGQMTPQGMTLLTMGLHSAIPYDSEAGAPTYITPPDGPANVISGAIAAQVRMALAQALLEGESAPAGPDAGVKAAASGVSLAYVFEKLNKRLATIADTMEVCWRQVLRLVVLWQGEDPDKLPEVPWNFPDTFEVRSLAQEVADISAILAGNPPSPTYKGMLWKKIVRKSLPKDEEDLIDTIFEEIDEGMDEAAMGRKLSQAELDARISSLPGGPMGNQDQVAEYPEEAAEEGKPFIGELAKASAL